MSRDLRGASVVVMGASSGVGRAPALAFADHGAALTLSVSTVDPVGTAGPVGARS
jgi:NAD(P)-dependent dehydrogenase (short-subunit alcohol dehydrogenase family)